MLADFNHIYFLLFGRVNQRNIVLFHRDYNEKKFKKYKPTILVIKCCVQRDGEAALLSVTTDSVNFVKEASGYQHSLLRNFYSRTISHVLFIFSIVIFFF
jgi:hypothetical protein